MAAELISRKSSLSANLVQIGRFFRHKGYTVTLTDEEDALKGLTWVPIYHKEIFKEVLKAVLVKNAHQFQQFDHDFEDYWQEWSKSADSKIKQSESKKPKQQTSPSLVALKSWLFKGTISDELKMASYSEAETLGHKEFGVMDESELDLLNQLLKSLQRENLREKRRLTTRSKKRRRIDIQSTIKAGMRRGGEIDLIKYQKKKDQKYKIVLLCDVSRSMELYSKFFIHFMYAFQNNYDKISTWVFSTSTFEVSDLLGNYEFDKAYERIAERVPQWSGGTKIGHCLERFNQLSGSWTIDRRTFVFIVSDGWDTGDQQSITHAMSTIHKKARKVIWLNPLAGQANFQAEVTGLKSAMPFIDHHQSCHSLHSLKEALKLIRLGRV